MAYMDKFIVAVKHNGRILRDTSDVVYLPFGSEYSILLKNKDSVKAVAKIEIDGADVVDGHSIIVPANESVELKGFMKGMHVTNRFKFIKKTKEISDYRGDRIDDGMIRVEFRFEIPLTRWVYTPPVEISPWRQGGSSDWMVYNSSTSMNCGSTFKDAQISFSANNITSCCVDEDGITVKGSKTNQDFTYGSTNALELQASVIILRLRGQRKTGIEIAKPVTTKTKFICSTCGKRSKSHAKFCSRCGTYLE